MALSALGQTQPPEESTWDHPNSEWLPGSWPSPIRPQEDIVTGDQMLTISGCSLTLQAEQGVQGGENPPEEASSPRGCAEDRAPVQTVQRTRCSSPFGQMGKLELEASRKLPPTVINTLGPGPWLPAGPEAAASGALPAPSLSASLSLSGFFGQHRPSSFTQELDSLQPQCPGSMGSEVSRPKQGFSPSLGHSPSMSQRSPHSSGNTVCIHRSGPVCFGPCTQAIKIRSLASRIRNVASCSMVSSRSPHHQGKDPLFLAHPGIHTRNSHHLNG